VKIWECSLTHAGMIHLNVMKTMVVGSKADATVADCFCMGKGVKAACACRQHPMHHAATVYTDSPGLYATDTESDRATASKQKCCGHAVTKPFCTFTSLLCQHVLDLFEQQVM